VDVNAADQVWDGNSRSAAYDNTMAVTPLVAAAYKADASVVQALLGRPDLDPNVEPLCVTVGRCSFGGTALHYAAQAPHHLEIFDLITGDRRTDFGRIASPSQQRDTAIHRLISSNQISEDVLGSVLNVMNTGRFNGATTDGFGVTILQAVLQNRRSTAPEIVRAAYALLTTQNRHRGVDPLDVPHPGRPSFEGQGIIEAIFAATNDGRNVDGREGVVRGIDDVCGEAQQASTLHRVDILAPIFGVMTDGETRALLTRRGPNGTPLEWARELRDHCLSVASTMAHATEPVHRTWDPVITVLERQAALHGVR
jgi:hypothetical protein